LVGHAEVLHQQTLVVVEVVLLLLLLLVVLLMLVVGVPQGHLQQLGAPVRAPGGVQRWRRQTVVVLSQLLLFDPHGAVLKAIVAHQLPAEEGLATSTIAGRVSLLLEHHLLRQLVHDGLGGQPGEGCDGREVAEHDHARAKAGVHAAAAAGTQEFVA